MIPFSPEIGYNGNNGFGGEGISMAFGDWVYSLLLLSFFAVIAVSMLYELRAHISPTPVLPWVRRAAMRMIKNNITDASVLRVADLGCGWGGMTTRLARAYPAAHIIGYEMSPAPYLISKLRGAFFGKRIDTLPTDFFKADLSGFDVVFCYLSPAHMEKLKPQLAALKKGSLVVTCSFPIVGWIPLETINVWSLVQIPINIYRI